MAGVTNGIVNGDWATIYVARYSDASRNDAIISWNNKIKMWYSKYNIKESDMRIKTATFDSPQFIDLTTGVYAIKIVSKYHENFAGIVLDVTYDEEKGIYSYQCQDFSRLYIEKCDFVGVKAKVYNVLRHFICHLSIGTKPTKKKLLKYKRILSGLRALSLYEQSLYKGNIYKGNPFNQNLSIIARDKSAIEVIRSIVFSSLGFFDVWFNDNGILQIEPLSKSDWENTGLHLNNYEYSERKFKFSTTNAITGVIANGSDAKVGKYFNGNSLVGLNLNAFFGNIKTSVSNQSNSTKQTNTTTTTKTNTSSVNTKSNPYGNKSKKIWIGADGGSGGFTKEIIKYLRKAGWSVHYSGEGANVHYEDYFNVTSDYQVLAIVDNGFDPATVIEPYENGSPKNALAKKKVTCMFFFDTRNWTNPQGMKPYRYGDFKGYKAPRAWDDNYSNFSGRLSVDSYFRKHKIKYCANPSAKGMVDMFVKGGYYASKGIKV